MNEQSQKSDNKQKLFKYFVVTTSLLSLTQIATPSITAFADTNDSATIQKKIDKLDDSNVTKLTDNLKTVLSKISTLQSEVVPVQARYVQLNQQIEEIQKSIEAQAPEAQAQQVNSPSSQFSGKSKAFDIFTTLFSEGLNDAAKQAVQENQLSDNIKAVQTSLKTKQSEAKKAKATLDDSIKQQVALAKQASDSLTKVYDSLGIDNSDLKAKIQAISDAQNKLLEDQIKGVDTSQDQTDLDNAQKAFETALTEQKSDAVTKENAAKIIALQQQVIQAKAVSNNSLKSNSNGTTTVTNAASGSQATVSSSSMSPTLPSGWNAYQGKQPTNSLVYGNASYPDGQCTSYAAGRARQFGVNIGNTFGPASQWAASASGAGLNVSSTPKAGSVVAFAPGVAGADGTYGHVGFVEEVHSDGSFLISEANVLGAVVSYRVISNATSGMSFIS